MVKVLAFTDMHGSMDAFRKIKEKSKNADIIVCAGDISIFGNDLDKILKRFDKLGKKMLIISGNHEMDSELKTIAKKMKNVFHMKDEIFAHENLFFLCSEGNGFSHRDTHFEKTGNMFLKKMHKIREHNKDSRFCLLTHAPPFKTKLDRIMEEHCGNKAIKKFIIKAKPDVHICGHIHENEGREDKIGKTKVINPGPYGKIIRIS